MGSHKIWEQQCLVLNVTFIISESDYTFGYAVVSGLVYSMLTHGHMAPGPLGESY